MTEEAINSNEEIKIPTQQEYNMINDEAYSVTTGGAEIHYMPSLLGTLKNLLYLIEISPPEKIPGLVEEYREKEKEVKIAINRIRLSKLG
jgi:hypothetical protein